MNIQDHLLPEKAVSTAKVFQQNSTKLLSIRLKKEAIFKDHSSKTHALLLCMEGKVDYIETIGKPVQLLKGDFVEIQPEITHRLEAKEDSLLVLAIT